MESFFDSIVFSASNFFSFYLNPQNSTIVFLEGFVVLNMQWYSSPGNFMSRSTVTQTCILYTYLLFRCSKELTSPSTCKIYPRTQKGCQLRDEVCMTVLTCIFFNLPSSCVYLAGSCTAAVSDWNVVVLFSVY